LNQSDFRWQSNLQNFPRQTYDQINEIVFTPLICVKCEIVSPILGSAAVKTVA